MNEHDFIAALRKLPLHPGARGLEDDCAVLEFGDETLIVSTDMMAEGTHWLPGTDEADIAHKLVASNLSDLAAKGAEPIGALFGFALSNDEYNSRFAHWLGVHLKRWNTPLLGGDTISGTDRIVSLTVIGRATHTPVPSRSAAKVGDGVFVTGYVGDAMIGHGSLTGAMQSVFMQNNDRVTLEPYFVDKFLRPQPLLNEGRALAPFVSAMMDVSDGLFLDALRMAQASNVSFDLEWQKMPFSPTFLESLDGNQLDHATSFQMTKDAALRWGDDYALLFTAPTDAVLPVSAKRIGSVKERADAAILVDGEAIDTAKPLGFEHR